MSESQEIPVEEDVTGEAKEESSESMWSEELRVAGDELLDTVKQLIHEAGVRRIVVRDSKDQELIKIPLVLGLAGIYLLPVYSALALITALATDCTIRVDRVGSASAAPEAA
jgi:hypothetical protein